MLPALLILPALSIVVALAPVRRPFPLAVVCWALSLLALEVPLHLGLLTAAATAGALLHGEVTLGDLAGTALAVLICAGLAVVLRRHLAAAPSLDRAFREAGTATCGTPSGTGPSETTTTTTTTTPSHPQRTRLYRTAWLSILLQPWPLKPRNIARSRLTYGPDPKANRFDLYTGAGTQVEAQPDVRGVLIHVHGGHFRAGGPSRESRAMLFDHAQRGWAAISTTYHLSPTPEQGFPQHLVDIKRLIQWIRIEGPEHGIPVDAPIVVAGSSAGAHITLMTALTANEPQFQPGFEHLDTTLAGAIGLYGFYGPLGRESKMISDPVRHSAAGAPPLVVVHGTADTYTPIRGSRRLVSHLRAGSTNPVVYAELPGAQHGFDAVRSPRYLAVVAAVARFTESLA